METWREHRRRRDKSRSNRGDNLAIYLLGIPLLTEPLTIMSVIVVNAKFGGALASTLTGYAALLMVMVVTGIILCAWPWLPKDG